MIGGNLIPVPTRGVVTRIKHWGSDVDDLGQLLPLLSNPSVIDSRSYESEDVGADRATQGMEGGDSCAEKISDSRNPNLGTDPSIEAGTVAAAVGKAHVVELNLVQTFLAGF